MNLFNYFIIVSVVWIWQKLESQVGELQTARNQAQQEVQKLQKEGSEVKQKAKELQRSLESEKAGWGCVFERISFNKYITMTFKGL